MNPITRSLPPAPVIRVVNPVLKLLLRTPLLGAARGRFMTVRFVGRKTGRAFTVVLGAHRVDGVLYALTGENSNWKYNFRGGAPARVLHDGVTTTMRGELIEDHGLIADLYSGLAHSYGANRTEQSMGIALRDHQMPTHDEFVEAVSDLGLRAIRFTPAP